MKERLFAPVAANEIQPLREAAVAEVEKRFGIRFPSAYLQVLREQNGGYIEYSCYPIKQLGIELPFSDGVLLVRGLAGIRNGSRDYDLEALTGLLPDWLANTPLDPNRYVALDGDGHWWVCFDKKQLNPRGEPALVYLELEGPRPTATVLADDFQQFLDRLEPEDY